MKTLFCVIGAILLGGSPLTAEEWTPPKALAQFWIEMKPEWNPASESEVWTYSDVRKTREYCEMFAKKNRPEAILPLMISDLKAYPSERRAIVYIWVSKYWPKAKVMRILDRYKKGNDEFGRQIAGDFIAGAE